MISGDFDKRRFDDGQFDEFKFDEKYNLMKYLKLYRNISSNCIFSYKYLLNFTFRQIYFAKFVFVKLSFAKNISTNCTFYQIVFRKNVQRPYRIFNFHDFFLSIFNWKDHQSG